MDYLVVYDICEPKRLRQVEKIMTKYGMRVQKSVFECFLSNKKRDHLKSTIQKVIDAEEDSFRLYPLFSQSRLKQTIIGRGEITDLTSPVVV